MGKISEENTAKEIIAEYINILGNFCGKRDIKSLTRAELAAKYKLAKADVMVLFGGSIMAGGDVLAQAIKNGIAKKYIIVGGIGHTTEKLRQKIHERYPAIMTAGLPEAAIFTEYLRCKYNMQPDFLETESTNCGNNITYLLKLLAKEKIKFNNIIITQDATMQYRMEAVLRKYANSLEIINFAAYHISVTVKQGKLVFAEEVPGMWSMQEYITLLMGEIVRLADTKDGYGPAGKNYIVHVAIPAEVQNAFDELKKFYGTMIRKAEKRYASK